MTNHVAILDESGRVVEVLQVERAGTRELRTRGGDRWSLKTGALIGGTRTDGGCSMRPATATEVQRDKLLRQERSLMARRESGSDAMGRLETLISGYEAAIEQWKREMSQTRRSRDAIDIELAALRADLTKLDTADPELAQAGKDPR